MSERNLKSLTKDDRGKVYAKVFAMMIRKSMDRSYSDGYCDIFSQALRELGLSKKTESFSYCENCRLDLRVVWPEMADVKPKDYYRDNTGCNTGYWWAHNEAGRKTRIKKMQWVLKEHFGINAPIPEGI